MIISMIWLDGENDQDHAGVRNGLSHEWLDMTYDLTDNDDMFYDV